MLGKYEFTFDFNIEYAPRTSLEFGRRTEFFL